MSDLEKKESISESWKKELLKRYESYIQKKGLKATKQRDLIVNHFFSRSAHVTVEQLAQEIAEVDDSIGLATIYRTINLLKEAGLAVERQFHNQPPRYEVIEEEHHDHLICTHCGKIFEFENEPIERLQEEVAAEHQFQLTQHRMELYGVCKGLKQKGVCTYDSSITAQIGS